MHPVLFRLPLPAWSIPLFPSLIALAGLGALLALFGWRRKAADFLIFGAVVAAAAGIAASRYRGESYLLGALPVYGYGAMLCLSLIVGWYLTLGLAERDGLPREPMANCYFVTALAALVGARLLYVVTNPDEFRSFTDFFALRSGGLVAYGGFLGGALGSLVFLKRARLRLLPWADVAVPSLASGLFVTRIGCYLFGCDFGQPLGERAPGWLKRVGTFPRWPDGTLSDAAGSPAWIEHVSRRGLSPDAGASLPVHPTQLYESAAGLLLLAMLLVLRRYQRFRGELFLAFTFAYGLIRFVIEIVRDDPERGVYGPFVAERWYVTLALVAFAAAWALGPSRSIAAAGVRRVTQLAALAPALAAYWLLRPADFGASPAVQLSTSQWIGLTTGIAAALGWAMLAKVAEANPAAAMSLGLPEPPPGDATAAPRKKKKRKKRPAAQPEA